MDVVAALADAFDRVLGIVHAVARDLDEDELTFRPDGQSNSIAWLLWHLTRVQDDHIADVAGTEQVWTALGWHERFGLPFPPSATGYGQNPSETALVTASAEMLCEYYDAVHEATLRFLRELDPESLERIVDRRWDPPVTLGVRLISVISDDLQHAGQAAYVRGLLHHRGHAPSGS